MFDLKTTKKIVSIAQEQVPSKGSVSFVFTPNQHHKKLIGIMATEDTELALSLQNGTDLIVNGLVSASKSNKAPDRRIYRLSEDLNCEIIEGVLMNLGTTTKQMSAYLIIQE